ncbi:dephospho-CoA kinase [Alicyclobacillus acidiphilus]|uniref:dephospho-CoA kinase n=1 Tax=Alicyclobacillus acidiphilus TaxID=182455 RepID=UPI0008350BAF|nr:dephospho-CoA kinase [Alicyclobacillus acidiphilus]
MKEHIIGLTGGIGTGKSTVSSMFRDLGAYIVDADVWARKVVEPGTEGLAEIVDAFGREVLLPDGTLNRKKLGAIVFSDDKARQTLNQIVHPRVRRGMLDETRAYVKQAGDKKVIWDVPLLFEGDTRHLVGSTIVVSASPDVQLARVMARDGIDEKAALARIRAQMPLEEKRRLATFVIDNDGTLENTRKQVERIWTTILNQADIDPSLSS